MSIIREIITQPLLAILFGLLTGLCGFFFGHRIALWRDRRKEFNDAAELLFAALSRERNIPQCFFGDSFVITQNHFHIFDRHLSRRKSKAFEQCVANLVEAQSEDNIEKLFAGYRYKDITKVHKAIDALMQFTKRK